MKADQGTQTGSAGLGGGKEKGAVTHSHNDLLVLVYFQFNLGDRMRRCPPSRTHKKKMTGNKVQDMLDELY